MAGKYVSKPSKKIIAAWIFLAVALVAGAVGIVAAKYIANYQKEAEIHASSFHFSSNLLEYGTKPELTVFDSGNHSVEFYLYNYQKENTALVSDLEIPYTISVSQGWNVAVTDAQGNAVTELKLPAETATYHKVTVTGTTSNSVDVVVTSTDPYVLELAAEFTLEPAQGAVYSVADKGDYCVMTISTYDYAGNVAVTWNAATHSPDNTNPLMAAWVDSAAISTGSFTAEAFHTYTLIFVESQPGNYTAHNFTVTTGV